MAREARTWWHGREISLLEFSIGWEWDQIRSSSSGVSRQDREGWDGGMHPKAPNCKLVIVSQRDCFKITYRHTCEESSQHCSATYLLGHNVSVSLAACGITATNP